MEKEHYVWCEDCDAHALVDPYDPEEAVPCCPWCGGDHTSAPATVGAGQWEPEGY